MGQIQNNKQLKSLLNEYLFKREDITTKEKKQKPSNYDTLKELGVYDKSTLDYFNNKKYNKRNNNNTQKQLLEYIIKNCLTIISENNINNFINKNYKYLYSSTYYPYVLTNTENIGLVLNNKILTDIVQFKKDIKTKNLFKQYTALNDKHVYFYDKHKYRKLLKKKEITKENKKCFYVLYQSIENVTELQNHNEHTYDDRYRSNNYFTPINKNKNDNFIILYPMTKFGENFFVVVTDSSSLNPIKTYKEFKKEIIEKVISGETPIISSLNPIKTYKEFKKEIIEKVISGETPIIEFTNSEKVIKAQNELDAIRGFDYKQKPILKPKQKLRNFFERNFQ